MKTFYKLTAIFVLIFSAVLYSWAETSDVDLVKKGNSFLQKVEKNENPELNSIYLNKAQYYFYVASKKEKPSTDALLGLGNVYLAKKRYGDAKKIFFQAYSMDSDNPDTNFALAEFHYEFENYESALNFYNKALQNKYKNKDKLLKNMAKCYEKLGDLENAQKTYTLVGNSEKSNEMKTLNKEVSTKDNQKDNTDNKK